jgi:hypothetical protein
VYAANCLRACSLKMDRSFKAREQAQYYTISPVHKNYRSEHQAKFGPKDDFVEDRASMNLLL